MYKLVIKRSMSTLKTDPKQEIRRNNLRNLAARHGSTKLAHILGYKSASWVSQLVGPKADRTITDDTVAKVEKALNLENGWLDLTHVDHVLPKSAAYAKTFDNLVMVSREENQQRGIDSRDALHIIHRALDKRGVSLNLDKFVILARVMMRDMERDGQFDEELFSDLIALSGDLPSDD